MTTDKHRRSIHIEAPVEAVFEYVENPGHIVAAMPEDHNATLGAVNRSADGAVETYEILYRELGRNRTTLVTREEFVANERLVDRTSVGPVRILEVEADDNGTTLTYAWDAPTWIKVLDAVFSHSDKDVERSLATFKHEIEALG
jgi:hypothetical protein